MTRLPSIQRSVELGRAPRPVSLAKSPGNFMPVAELAVRVRQLQPMRPVAKVVEQSSRLLPRTIPGEAEAEAGQRKSCRGITCLTPALVARASSVCAYTKNKHGLRFGGRDEETEVYMSNIVGKPLIAGGGIGKGLEFTYTGDYTEREDGVVELRSSGTITFPKTQRIDIFCVGGGGAGGTNYYNVSVGCGGGGGGFTKTAKRQTVSGTYTVTIGAGGAVTGGGYRSGAGSASSFGEIVSANGGDGGRNSESSDYGTRGGNGGSGGGAGGKTTSGVGGSNGEAGGNSESQYATGGTGQGTTTREFGESAGKLYAGGGGGGIWSTQRVAGGEGGGGAGACTGVAGSVKADAGTANTGGGGGGGLGTSIIYSGTGGSGVVCIRVSTD